VFNARDLSKFAVSGYSLPRTSTTDSHLSAAVAGPLADAANGLKGRVRSNLLYLSKVRGAVVKEGERETATWRLPGQ
jgi:hypothetical protein